MNTENTALPEEERPETSEPESSVQPEVVSEAEKVNISVSESPIKKQEEGLECRYCNDEANPDRVSHLVCIEMADGHIHVHAPFGDKRAIYRFLDAIETELARHKRAPDPVKRGGAVIK